MINFGSPIKHRIVYINTDGVECASTLTCINELDGIEILKSLKSLKYKHLVSFSKLDDCEDCKL